MNLKNKNFSNPCAIYYYSYESSTISVVRRMFIKRFSVNTRVPETYSENRPLPLDVNLSLSICRSAFVRSWFVVHYYNRDAMTALKCMYHA